VLPVRGAALQEDLTFQSIEQEVASLPGCYSAPSGCILLASWQPPDQASSADIGCVAIRPLPGEAQGGSGEPGGGAAGRRVCEMKRLWVQEAHQRSGLGRQLVQAAVAAARDMGYQAVVLDTLERLTGANRVYESLGFARRDAYYHNPLPNVVYWQLDLL
jgi:GNAT superfamily N-acetyltransferase